MKRNGGCDVCGEPMATLSLRRRLALWARDRLERLAFRLDVWTAPRFDAAKPAHLHLTDAEWADLRGALEE